MIRYLSAALLVAVLPTVALAQGPVQRAGQALDDVGQNIRRNIEDASARRQITAQERQLLARVENRVLWDKQMVGSTLHLIVGADGAVVLQGYVPDEAAKTRAIDLAQSTQGVSAVVDEISLARDAKVLPSAPTRVILAPPVDSPVVVQPTRMPASPSTEIIVPRGTKVIEK